MATDPALRRLALGTLLAAFRGPVPPPWALDLLADGLAGHTLFGTNIGTFRQVVATTAALRAARDDALIAIDEEGGDITRLDHATGSRYPGNAALGAVDDPALTGRVYAAIGAELAASGINLNFAPTVDVNSCDENPVIGTRAFGADPRRVATHTAAAVTGLQSTGVAACAKHFPGHGATITDSHLALPTVDVAVELLRRRDLLPFAAAVAAGARAVMTAHIRVPALTGDAPATFSRAALTDLLRAELGFTGAIVTDALEMKGAVLAAGGVGPGAVRALAAGADLLCIGARVDADLVEETAAAIVTAVTDGQLPLARLEEAAARTAALAAWARPAPPETFTEADLGYAVARRAVRVEGALDGLAEPLVLRLHSGSTLVQERVPWGLGPHLDGGEELRIAAAETDVAALRALAGVRPIVVVGRRLHGFDDARALVEALAAAHPVTVVEMGWPGQWRPAAARAFVITYGAGHANARAAAELLGLAGHSGTSAPHSGTSA